MPYRVREEAPGLSRGTFRREALFFGVNFLESLIVTVALYFLLWCMGFLFQHIPDLPHPVARVAYGTFVVVGLSAALFKMKISSLQYYAVLEGGFALFVCIATLAGMGDRVGSAQIGSLLASVYLFIRAADNFKKGLDERKKAAKLADALASENPL